MLGYNFDEKYLSDLSDVSGDIVGAFPNSASIEIALKRRHAGQARRSHTLRATQVNRF